MSQFSVIAGGYEPPVDLIEELDAEAAKIDEKLRQARQQDTSKIRVQLRIATLEADYWGVQRQKYAGTALEHKAAQRQDEKQTQCARLAREVQADDNRELIEKLDALRATEQEFREVAARWNVK